MINQISATLEPHIKSGIEYTEQEIRCGICKFCVTVANEGQHYCTLLVPVGIFYVSPSKGRCSHFQAVKESEAHTK